MRPEFSAVPFLEPAKAESNLVQVEQRLAPTLRVPLASLLAQSPDPDGALNFLERYVEKTTPEVRHGLAQHPTALTYLIAIFSFSSYLAETLLAEPELTIQFARDRDFTQPKSKEDLMEDYARFATTNPEPWLSAQLARFKRRSYLRIVLKDVLGIFTLGEVTLEISLLADVILANALIFCDRELEKRYGQPQYRDAQGRIERCGFSVVSLGKLGGNELNYSSDIDLLFLYAHDGETAGASERGSAITNKEYSVHLAHAITRTLTQATSHGQVYRVDLRLRPEGDQGELATSLDRALEYYKTRAREWELQMLIKARHSAGDAHLTREFLHGVEPYSYGPSTNFEAVESVLWAREKISKRLRESRGQALDLKRHRGGIRDIEFLVQCCQRLQGGHHPWVRSGGTLFALRKLNDKGLLSDRDYAALNSAYEFLRKVEHRIQLEWGQQTHRLPAAAEALDRLARRVGLDGRTPAEPGKALLARLQETFAAVNEIYQRTVHPQAAAAAGGPFELKPLLVGVGDPEPHSWDSVLSFLDGPAPELAHLAREVQVPERARKNGVRFFAALLGSSERFRLARQQPEQIRRALELIGASDYLAELLIYHPENLVVFDTPFSVSPVEAAASQCELDLDNDDDPEPFPWAAERGLGIRERMTLLRRYYRARVLELGAADLAGGQPIFPVLRRWSSLAARAIASALWMAQEALESKGTIERSTSLPLAVLALGRLGFNEFDLASDADLVFVAAAGATREEIASLTRLAEKTIEILSSYTREGALFAVDTRLRPRGQEGELVVTEDGLLSYLAEDAKVWEGLTYMKVNPVGGNFALGRQIASRLAPCLFDRFAAYPDLEGELHRMRRRLEREKEAPASNTKTAPGGYYDVDFAVAYLRLRNRLAVPAGANMGQRIAVLRAAGLISEEDSTALTEGSAFLRSVDHALRLVIGKAASSLPEHVGHAEAVDTLARRWGLVESSETLAQRLHAVQQQVRYVYRRLVEAE
jgi:glutamate-ammonia-ligase adenylyltransferase